MEYPEVVSSARRAPLTLPYCFGSHLYGRVWNDPWVEAQGLAYCLQGVAIRAVVLAMLERAVHSSRLGPRFVCFSSG